MFASIKPQNSARILNPPEFSDALSGHGFNRAEKASKKYGFSR